MEARARTRPTAPSSRDDALRAAIATVAVAVGVVAWLLSAGRPGDARRPRRPRARSQAGRANALALAAGGPTRRARGLLALALLLGALVALTSAARADDRATVRLPTTGYDR